MIQEIEINLKIEFLDINHIIILKKSQKIKMNFKSKIWTIIINKTNYIQIKK